MKFPHLLILLAFVGFYRLGYSQDSLFKAKARQDAGVLGQVKDGQNCDTIFSSPFIYLVKYDNFFQGIEFNRIAINANQKTMVFGNLNSKGVKEGKWVYFDTEHENVLCSETFKNGVRNPEMKTDKYQKQKDTNKSLIEKALPEIQKGNKQLYIHGTGQSSGTVRYIEDCFTIRIYKKDTAMEVYLANENDKEYLLKPATKELINYLIKIEKDWNKNENWGRGSYQEMIIEIGRKHNSFNMFNSTRDALLKYIRSI